MIEIKPPLPSAKPGMSLPPETGSPAIRHAQRHPEAGTCFELSNYRFCHALVVLDDGTLGTLHTGKKVRNLDVRQLRLEGRGYSGGVFTQDHDFCLEHIRQDYPAQQRTDYRSPAYVVTGPDGTGLSGFRYLEYQVMTGKPGIPGLPATYVEDPIQAETLRITLKDELTGTLMHLYWSIWDQYDALSRWVIFEQPADSTQTVTINAAMSASFDLPFGDGKFLSLHGAWARERHPVLRDIAPGIQGCRSNRGASSHFQHPFAAVMSPGANEASGEVFGLSLIYSGNFEIFAETDPFGVTRLWTGINREGFSWELRPGETFATPEAVLVWSELGLEDMSLTFHELYRDRLIRGPWRNKGRPVLINTWEASYFGVNHQKVMDIARGAKDLGVELVVLDDGWFTGRNADNSSLGDWDADPLKFSQGLGALGQEINALGMQFGIWVEPEMISEKSALFQSHPDWLIQVPGRSQSHARNQYVLDLGRPEVQDWMINRVAGVVESAPIAYVKWDMNRSMTEIGSGVLPPHRQKETCHRYILGLYRVMETLTSRYPQILWESCAGGGGRFDPGLLHYMPQAWTSDDTDAVERLKIQYATSLVYPFSAMGAHVSVVPNHQTGRATPFGFRALAAAFGAFGYELDPAHMDDADRAAAAWWTEFCKRERDFMVNADFFRLRSPFANLPGRGGFGDTYGGLEREGNTCAWMLRSRNRKRALVAWFMVQNRPNPGFGRLVLAGLEAEHQYQVQVIDASRAGYFPPENAPEWHQKARVLTVNQGTRGGDELMTLGLSLGGESWNGIGRGDHQALLFLLS